MRQSRILSHFPAIEPQQSYSLPPAFLVRLRSHSAAPLADSCHGGCHALWLLDPFAFVLPGTRSFGSPASSEGTKSPYRRTKDEIRTNQGNHGESHGPACRSFASRSQRSANPLSQGHRALPPLQPLQCDAHCFTETECQLRRWLSHVEPVGTLRQEGREGHPDSRSHRATQARESRRNCRGDFTCNRRLPVRLCFRRQPDGW